MTVSTIVLEASTPVSGNRLHPQSFLVGCLACDITPTFPMSNCPLKSLWDPIPFSRHYSLSPPYLHSGVPHLKQLVSTHDKLPGSGHLCTKHLWPKGRAYLTCRSTISDRKCGGLRLAEKIPIPKRPVRALHVMRQMASEVETCMPITR